jgi:site-specific recombinase XerD
MISLRYFRDYLIREYKFPADSFSLHDSDIQLILAKVPAGQNLQCLNQAQVAALLSSLESSPRPRALRDRAILMLMLESGLSVGAITGLDMTDIDLQAERFHVYLLGKGDLWLAMGQAVGSVAKYIREGRPYLLHHPGEPALFISQMDGRLSRQGIWQILNHWGGTVDPPISLSPRILRHTAALRMSMAGYSVTDIQVRLGHRNPLSTRALIRRLEAACTNLPDQTLVT